MEVSSSEPVDLECKFFAFIVANAACSERAAKVFFPTFAVFEYRPHGQSPRVTINTDQGNN